MRGEDGNARLCVVHLHGSPPHARGRLYVTKSECVSDGITPACAGKTSVEYRTSRSAPDHPRMRGEDSHPVVRAGDPRGSPPHARGRHFSKIVRGIHKRITPACAGKTDVLGGDVDRHADHPRMRGEDVLIEQLMPGSRGSPPHARGRLKERKLNEH